MSEMMTEIKETKTNLVLRANNKANNDNNNNENINQNKNDLLNKKIKVEQTLNDKTNTNNNNNILKQHGVNVLQKITSTLQGNIYTGFDDIYGDCIIKTCDINLHKKKLGIIGKEIVNVHEDIIKEANIMIYLQNSIEKPKGILKVYHFLFDSKNFYIIMEHGGTSLYKHCEHFHKEIENGNLSVKEWLLHVKILFKQIINIVNWLHYNKKLCHLDISLENILIKGYVFKKNKFLNHGQIYLCDFGLSEIFINNNNFLCNKYAGKTLYECPEIIYKQSIYDARLADVWSLGVCLFMMQIGNQPMIKAHQSDVYFVNIINGKLKHLLLKGGKKEYISDDFIDLLNNMFCLQDRYYVSDIIKHSFMK